MNNIYNSTTNGYYNSDPKVDQFINYATMYMSVEQIKEIIIKLNHIKDNKEKQESFLYSACNFTNY